MKKIKKLSLVVGLMLFITTLLVGCKHGKMYGYGEKKIERKN
jgi:hypothetical protein